jgi:hypothetical protein
MPLTGNILRNNFRRFIPKLVCRVSHSTDGWLFDFETFEKHGRRVVG